VANGKFISSRKMPTVPRTLRPTVPTSTNLNANFFSLDGVDGAGKSTQIDLFIAWLQEKGRDVVSCRDPGSTKLGEQLRGLVLTQSDMLIDLRSEMLIYMAARAQMVEEVIRPALMAGKTVVSDRFLLANVVYQGHAGGLDPKEIWEVGSIAIAGVQPALTLVLDIDPADAAGRMQRELDRMESRGEEYSRQVRAGFLHEAKRHTDSMVVIDATPSIEVVHEQIRAAAAKYC